MSKNLIAELESHLKLHEEWPALPQADKIRFLGLGLSGEAGELANDIKKQWRGDFANSGMNIFEFEDRLRKEIYDVCNYAFMLASVLGEDIEGVLNGMLDKLLEVEQRPAFINRRRS